MTTTDERRQTCDQCGTTRPLTDLNVWWGAGVQVECKDRGMCEVRARGRQMVAYAAVSGHDDECEAEFVPGAMSWTGCRCDERLDDGDDQ